MLTAGHDYRTSIDRTYFIFVSFFSKPIFANNIFCIYESKNSQQFLAPQVSVLSRNKAINSSTLLRSRFLITLFLAIKFWARIPLQIRDSPSALFPYLCVDFHKCRHVLALHFKVKFDQHFVQWVLQSRLTSNLQNYIILESSEAYLLKLEENLS